MDAKTGLTILMLILLLGITAYLKKERIESYGIVDKLMEMKNGLSPQSSNKIYNIGISYHGDASISGEGFAKGPAKFYFPEKTSIGKNIMAERWVSMNITSASFTLNNGITIKGRANRIWLENGEINGSFDISFSTKFFSVNGTADIILGNMSSSIKVGDISLNPSSSEIKHFSGMINWMDNKSIEGTAGLVRMRKGNVIYTAEELSEG